MLGHSGCSGFGSCSTAAARADAAPGLQFTASRWQDQIYAPTGPYAGQTLGNGVLSQFGFPRRSPCTTTLVSCRAHCARKTGAKLSSRHSLLQPPPVPGASTAQAAGCWLFILPARPLMSHAHTQLPRAAMQREFSVCQLQCAFSGGDRQLLQCAGNLCREKQADMPGLVQMSTSGSGSAPATWSSATSSSTWCSSSPTSTLAVWALCQQDSREPCLYWLGTYWTSSCPAQLQPAFLTGLAAVIGWPGRGMYFCTQRLCKLVAIVTAQQSSGSSTGSLIQNQDVAAQQERQWAQALWTSTAVSRGSRLPCWPYGVCSTCGTSRHES